MERKISGQRDSAWDHIFPEHAALIRSRHIAKSPTSGVSKPAKFGGAKKRVCYTCKHKYTSTEEYRLCQDCRFKKPHRFDDRER